MVIIIKVFKEVKANNKIYVVAMAADQRLVAGEYTYRKVINFKEVDNLKEGEAYIEKIISDS